MSNSTTIDIDANNTEATDIESLRLNIVTYTQMLSEIQKRHVELITHIRGMSDQLLREMSNALSHEFIRRRGMVENEAFYALSVERIPMSKPLRAFMRASGIDTLGDLCSLSKEDILGTPNIGGKRLREIEDILDDYCLELGDESWVISHGYTYLRKIGGSFYPSIERKPLTESELTEKYKRKIRRR